MLSTFEKIVLCASAVAIILGSVLANIAADEVSDDATNLYTAFMTKPKGRKRPSGTITIEEID